MELGSSAFAASQEIPLRHGGKQANVSPPLSWSGAPPQTRSFGLSMIDEIAPGRIYLHWLVCDIPAAVTALDEGISGAGRMPAGSRELKAYIGPFPPSGTHTYRFTLYAVDTDRLAVPDGAQAWPTSSAPWSGTAWALPCLPAPSGRRVAEPTGPPRPLPAYIRPFTTHVIDPVTRLVSGRLPGFGTIVHVGRRSSRVYRTPVNVFRDSDDWIIALTYGSQVQWVRNVRAAGGCELETRWRTVELTGPEVFFDPTRHLMPQPVRFLLGLMRVTEFLRLHPVS